MHISFLYFLFQNIHEKNVIKFNDSFLNKKWIRILENETYGDYNIDS